MSRRAADYARGGDIRGLAREHKYGLVKTFFGSVLVILLCLVPGVMILAWIFPLLPEKVLRGFSYIYSIIPIVGVAVALSAIKLRGAVPLFAGIFLIVAIFMKFL